MIGKKGNFNVKSVVVVETLSESEWKEKVEIRQAMKITTEQHKQLEEWTGLKCTDIVFDSNVDNWSAYTSVLNDRIIGKKQLVFLIEDEDGEKFGYYLNTEVVEKYDDWIKTDYKSFEFNLVSNGRLQHPMKNN